MIQVDGNRDIGFIRQNRQIAAQELDVRRRAVRNIQNNRSVKLFRDFDDRARVKLAAYIRSYNAIVFLACAIENFFHRY